MIDFVVMLCGPHEDDHARSPQFHRVNAAIRLAKRYGRDLLICGDATGGSDVELFARHAVEHGCSGAIPLYDADKSTLTDVRSALRHIRDNTGGHSSGTVHVVTDEWHMPRAIAMFRGEANHILVGDQEYVFEPISVVGGKRPEKWQRMREAKGIEDYLQGRYRSDPALAWGKPA